MSPLLGMKTLGRRDQRGMPIPDPGEPEGEWILSGIDKANIAHVRERAISLGFVPVASSQWVPSPAIDWTHLETNFDWYVGANSGNFIRAYIAKNGVLRLGGFDGIAMFEYGATRELQIAKTLDEFEAALKHQRILNEVKHV